MSKDETQITERPAVDPGALRSFFLTGVVDSEAVGQVGVEGYLPASLAPYRETDVRGPYPVLAFQDGREPVSLRGAIDGLVEALGDSDADERKKRVLLRIEKALKDQEGDAAEALAGVRDSIEGAVAKGWDEEVKASFALVADLVLDATLLGYGDQVLRVLAHQTANKAFARHAASWLEEAATLQRSLEALAEVEKDESDTVPEHLQQLTGGAFSDAFDFQELGNLLESAPHATSLPEARLERLTSALEALRGYRRVLSEGDEVAPVPVDRAKEVMKFRMQRTVALARAMTLATLESSDRFDPTIHERRLKAMSPEFLGDEDRGIIPPVVVLAEADRLSAVQVQDLTRMLEGRAPYKVLLVCRSVREEPGSAGWDLVDRAVWAPDTFAAETSLSDLAGVQSVLNACFDHQGPAVVGVYAPDHYLVAAAALEGRAVPAFSCAPAGLSWRDRFELGNNPTSGDDWSSDPSGTAQFSWADFAALLPSLSGLFLVLPSGVSNESLVPAAQWLELPSEDRARRLPFTTLHDAEGEERTAVPSTPVMTRMRRVRNRWRRLRELGGVSNSFEAAVRESMEAEQRAALEQLKRDLEDRHQAEMNQAVAGLAEEIVSNIARSLLRENGSVDLDAVATVDPARASVGPSALGGLRVADEAPANQPVKVEAETQAPGAEEETIDEEPLVLDEAWVETVRCTSCNECTDLNGMIFAYDDNKQAYIKDASAGPYRDLVIAAEKCPAAIIHPGKPLNPDEPHLEELLERAARFQ